MPKRSYIGAFHRSQWKRQQHAEDPTCRYCGRATLLDHTGDLEATVDHAQPLSKGGLDREDNWVLACWLCNTTKGSGKFCSDRRRAQFVKRRVREITRLSIGGDQK